jgi:hypothetical protein
MIQLFYTVVATSVLTWPDQRFSNRPHTLETVQSALGACSSGGRRGVVSVSALARMRISTYRSCVYTA